jgi:ATP-dependent Clp protease ATP-binding subunit ClpB
VGSAIIQDLGEAERETMVRRVQDELRNFFRPEFLNRIDEIVIFHALSEKEIGRIVEIQTRYLANLLRERDLKLEITPAAAKALAHEGYDPAFGARPLKRTIQRRIQNPLALRLLEGAFTAGNTVRVDYKDGDFVFDKAPAGETVGAGGKK